MLARRLHPFTVQDYQRMAETGILQEDDRVELLDGEILEMSPIGSRHAAIVDYLNAWFSREMGAEAIVRVQSPVRLSLYSEPQPDLTLLKPRPDFYENAHPGPEDVLLLIEVAESSLDYDRDFKLPRYGEASILESWLIDLAGQRLLAYKEPLGRCYRTIQEYHSGDSVPVRAFPSVSLSLESVLK